MFKKRAKKSFWEMSSAKILLRKLVFRNEEADPHPQQLINIWGCEREEKMSELKKFSALRKAVPFTFV